MSFITPISYWSYIISLLHKTSSTFEQFFFFLYWFPSDSINTSIPQSAEKMASDNKLLLQELCCQWPQQHQCIRSPLHRMKSAAASVLALDKKTHSSRLHHGKLQPLCRRCSQPRRQWTFSRIPGDMIAFHLSTYLLSSFGSTEKWPSLRRKMSALKKVGRRKKKQHRVVFILHELRLQWNSIIVVIWHYLKCTYSIVGGGLREALRQSTWVSNTPPPMQTWSLSNKHSQKLCRAWMSHSLHWMTVHLSRRLSHLSITNTEWCIVCMCVWVVGGWGEVLWEWKLRV